MAATLLKISGLKYWVGRQWCTGLFHNSFDSIRIISQEFLFKKKSTKSTNNLSKQTGPIGQSDAGTPKITTPADITSPTNFFHTQFFANDQALTNEEVEKEAFTREINLEIEKLRKILTENNSKVILETKSTKYFWIDHLSEFPHLSKLALMLSNINCSSAMVERYFSICGFVQDKRKMNISTELFMSRCFLRANKNILNELNKAN